MKIVMISKILLLMVSAVVVAWLAVALYGNARWNAGTTQLLNKLDAAQIKTVPQFYNARELEGLPAPVKRYMGRVYAGLKAQG